jgi:hypothetical protein
MYDRPHCPEALFENKNGEIGTRSIIRRSYHAAAPMPIRRARGKRNRCPMAYKIAFSI